MPVVVQPVVTEEKLHELLAEQTESDVLDFKRTLDLGSKKHLCELAKDVGAMQARGGYIVVGADDHGVPSGDLEASRLTDFDEARLRSRLLKYLPEPLGLRIGIHEVNGKHLVLIYIQPNPKGFAIFRADGNYDGGCAFREGDVFVRHGTSSERWTQADVDRIIAAQVALEKASWFAERREEMEHFRQTTSAASLAREAPAESLTWDLDPDTFRTMVIEQLRRNDLMPLKLFLRRALSDASRFVTREESLPELETLLDRLFCLAALTLELEEDAQFDRIISSLAGIYNLGFDARGFERTLAIGRERFWLMMIERILALGGVAVREENWRAVRKLATTKGTGYDFVDRAHHYASWIRHGLTMAARANLFVSLVDGKKTERSLISLAHAHAQTHECLRSGLPSDDERILTSICQFDALAMVVVIGEAKKLDVYYPSFAPFHEYRTQPMLARLTTDDRLRSEIFPLNDQDLANALRYLDDAAQQVGWRFAGWDSIHDPQLLTFLEQHPPSEP